MKKKLLYTYKVYDAFNRLQFVSPVLLSIRDFVYEEYDDIKLVFNYGTMTVKGYKVDKVLNSDIHKNRKAKQAFIGPFPNHKYIPPPGPDVIGYYYNESKKNELNLIK